MNRFRLIGLALCASAVVLWQATSFAQSNEGQSSGGQGAARTLSVATLAPPGSTWMRVFESWNREVRRRSNNTLQFRFYPGGVQGDEAEVIRKIRNGRLDGAAVTAVGLSQIHRPALVFQMPGILRTYAQLDRAREQMSAEMDAGFSAAGFVHLGWADVGQSRVFSTTPIRRPADLGSRKPWVWRDDLILPALFQVVPSHPVPLQVPEVLGALQTNRVDTLFAAPTPMVALQWSSRVRSMTDVIWANTIGGTVVGKRQFDSLTAEQRTVLRETGLQFHALARRNLRNDERGALSAMSRRNIETVTLTPAEQTEWADVAAQVRRRLAGQIADAALIARIEQFPQ